MTQHDRLEGLTPGMAIPWGGSHVTYVDDALAAAFAPGDQLIVMQHSGELLHVPAEAATVARDAVTAAADAFGRMGDVTDDQITEQREADETVNQRFVAIC